jgi:ribosome-associated heat shock protein Hsp15
VKSDRGISAAESRRLDQWLWFARLVKSRSLAARLCTAGAITVNQVTIRKANHMVRIGDTIAVPQGTFRRSVRLLGLGVRRGPAAEARRLYEEIAAPVHRSKLIPAWTPLLAEEDGALTRSGSNLSGKQFRY